MLLNTNADDDADDSDADDEDYVYRTENIFSTAGALVVVTV